MRYIILFLVWWITTLDSMAQVSCTPNAYYVPDWASRKDGAYYNYPSKWLNYGDSRPCEDWDGWILVANDEFNTPELNKNIWKGGIWPSIHSMAIWSADGGISYATHYPDGMTFANGYMNIWEKHYETPFWARSADNLPDDTVLKDGKRNMRVWSFSHSSGVASHHNYPSGKSEMRCKIPSNPLSWPAFWGVRTQASCRSEVDGFEFIMEGNCNFDSYANKPRFSLHGNKCNGIDKPIVSSELNYYCKSTDFTKAHHVFSYDWSKNAHVFWRIDGGIKRMLYQRIGLAGLHQHGECDKVKDAGFHRISATLPNVENLPVIIGTNIADKSGCLNKWISGFPDKMEVDYWRYYMHIKCDKKVDINSHKFLVSDFETPTCHTGGTINVRNVTVPGCEIGKTVDWRLNMLFTLVASSEINIYDGFDVFECGDFNAIIRPCSSNISYGKNSEDTLGLDEVPYYIAKSDEEKGLEESDQIGEGGDENMTTEKLSELHEKGEITLEEYEEIKGILVEKIQVFVNPNPVTDYATATVLVPKGEKYKLIFTDMPGIMRTDLYEGYATDDSMQFQLNTTNIDNGFYQVVVISQQGTKAAKLIVSK